MYMYVPTGVRQKSKQWDGSTRYRQPEAESKNKMAAGGGGLGMSCILQISIVL